MQFVNTFDSEKKYGDKLLMELTKPLEVIKPTFFQVIDKHLCLNLFPILLPPGL